MGNLYGQIPYGRHMTLLLGKPVMWGWQRGGALNLTLGEYWVYRRLLLFVGLIWETLIHHKMVAQYIICWTERILNYFWHKPSRLQTVATQFLRGSGPLNPLMLPAFNVCWVTRDDGVSIRADSGVGPQQWRLITFGDVRYQHSDQQKRIYQLFRSIFNQPCAPSFC